ncbi:MAG: neutral/alkaline non-lysosomal ceramidase N-terminal domain-containing protein [Candidatus Omnitrophica bacterium]|nr:neutral/alkaline non-lysosomal ceramidase N-terminal domain-containing protein [Candidatus Omnitrophota bacterium]
MWGITISVFVAGIPAGDAAAAVTAGVAKETFVLPAHVPLAGYSRRRGKPSRGLHDPVGVRALVIRDSHATAALVSCDLLMVDEHLWSVVRRRLLAEGLPQDVVLLLAGTHTHSGPGAYGMRFLEKISMGHFDPRVFEAIVEAIIRAILDAQAAMQPVRLASQAAMTSGLVVNRIEPEGLIDPELSIMTVYPERTNEPLAVLVNFAAHPTTMGAWNRELSADYPGVVMREVERQVAGTTCLFFAGAVGDQAPVKSGSGFERAEAIGHPLVESVMALISAARPEAPHGVQALQERLVLPPAQVRVKRFVFPRWLGQWLVDDDATLTVVAVGRSVFLGVPCDLAASLGETLKQAARAKGFEPMIIGFANDYIGYCVSEALYKAKQYESSMAFNGPHAGEQVVEHLVEMLDRLSAP